MHLFKLKSRLSRIRASSDSYVLSAHKRTAQDPPNTTLHPFYMSQSKVNPNWTPPDPPLMSAFDHWYKCCPALLDALCPLCHPSHPHTVSCVHDLSIFVQPRIIEVNHRMLFQQLLITLSFSSTINPDAHIFIALYLSIGCMIRRLSGWLTTTTTGVDMHFDFPTLGSSHNHFINRSLCLVVISNDLALGS